MQSPRNCDYVFFVDVWGGAFCLFFGDWCLAMFGMERQHGQTLAGESAQDIFDLLDVDDSGFLTQMEFVEGLPLELF